MTPVFVHGDGRGKLGQTIEIGKHLLSSDEPPELGDDSGPAPLDLLLSALGACTAMTLRLYAQRRGYAVRDVHVSLTGERKGDAYVIERAIAIDGDIDDAARARLLEIANKCPLHKTLTGPIAIASTLR
jgi:putative redox protein